MSTSDRALIRELLRCNWAAKKELAGIQETMLDLMDRRDILLDEMERTAVGAVAEKFGISKSQVVYITQLRAGRYGRDKDGD